MRNNSSADVVFGIQTSDRGSSGVSPMKQQNGSVLAGYRNQVDIIFIIYPDIFNDRFGRIVTV